MKLMVMSTSALYNSRCKCKKLQPRAPHPSVQRNRRARRLPVTCAGDRTGMEWTRKLCIELLYYMSMLHSARSADRTGDTGLILRAC